MEKKNIQSQEKSENIKQKFQDYFKEKETKPQNTEYCPYIIPEPQQVQINSGIFNLQTLIQNSNSIPVNLKIFNNEENKYEFYKKSLLNQLNTIFTEQLSINIQPIHQEIQEKQNNTGIEFYIFRKEQKYQKDAYSIYVNENQIIIEAHLLENQNFINLDYDSGFFYAIQTLKQLIFQYKSFIPCCIIQDAPNYSWRGMHLDVARHYQPVEFIKELLDHMAFLKLNVFHWHLVDDQGWRFYVEKYPKLTQIGGIRTKTQLKFRTKMFDNTVHQGYYTPQEIKEIVEYAQNNHIHVLPEIEGPGHVQALLASYPEYGCSKKTPGVMSTQGISRSLLNMKESTFQFLFDVYDEIIKLFPFETIHIGGDEVRYKEQWETDEFMLDFQEQNKIGVNDIQTYYTKRIVDYLNSKNKKVAGWNEIMDNSPDDYEDKITIMAWQRDNHLLSALNKEYKTIACSQKFLYFDIYENAFHEKKGILGRQGEITLKNTYEYDPSHKLKQFQKENLIGVQGQAWSESMKNPGEVEFKIFPRILALSEVAWCNPQIKQDNYFYFAKKARFYCQKYFKLLQVNYCSDNLMN